jgi:hypothetical protein
VMDPLRDPRGQLHESVVAVRHVDPHPINSRIAIVQIPWCKSDAIRWPGRHAGVRTPGGSGLPPDVSRRGASCNQGHDADRAGSPAHARGASAPHRMSFGRIDGPRAHARHRERPDARRHPTSPPRHGSSTLRLDRAREPSLGPRRGGREPGPARARPHLSTWSSIRALRRVSPHVDEAEAKHERVDGIVADVEGRDPTSDEFARGVTSGDAEGGAGAVARAARDAGGEARGAEDILRGPRGRARQVRPPA